MYDRGLNIPSRLTLRREKRGGESFPGQARLPHLNDRTRSLKRGKSWTVRSGEEHRTKIQPTMNEHRLVLGKQLT